MTAPMQGDDPLAPLLVPSRQGAAALGLRYRTGVVVAWDHSSGANTIRIDDQERTNLAVMPGAVCDFVRPGDPVSLLFTVDDHGVATYIVAGMPVAPPDPRLALLAREANTATYGPGELSIGQGSQYAFTRNTRIITKALDTSRLIVRGFLSFNTNSTVTPNSTSIVSEFFFIEGYWTQFGVGEHIVGANHLDTQGFIWVVPNDGSLPAGQYEIGWGIYVNKPIGAGSFGGPRIGPRVTTLEIEELA